MPGPLEGVRVLELGFEVAGPADFAGTGPAIPTRPPELAQHTVKVPLELGCDWERVAGLRDSGPGA